MAHALNGNPCGDCDGGPCAFSGPYRFGIGLRGESYTRALREAQARGDDSRQPNPDAPLRIADRTLGARTRVRS